MKYTAFSMVIALWHIGAVAADLSTGKIFRTADEGACIKIISADELELTYEKDGPHWVCKYSVQNDMVRVVATFLGSPQALYFKIIPEGFQPGDGAILYDDQHFEIAARAAKLKEEERQRQQAAAAKANPTPQTAPPRAVGTLDEFRNLAVFAPKPAYPYEARARHITGSGVVVLAVDAATGEVTNAAMAQSIGSPILDNAALSAFRRWRFKPGSTTSKVRVPINFTLEGVL